MLYLINQGKGGRNFKIASNEEVHWKEIFKNSEDSLTSSVFSLLFYLPADLMWGILTSACYGTELPKQAGRLLFYTFWPKYNYEHSTFTEPDVLIEFETFDVLIEAKRFDYNQQYLGQWQAEINAYYLNQDTFKKVYLIAIGGISYGDELTEKLTNSKSQEPILAVKSRWKKLLAEILKVQNQLLRLKVTLSTTDSVINILNDLILAFRIHGFVTTELLNTLPNNIRINELSLQTISCYKLKAQYSIRDFPQNLLNIKNTSLNLKWK